MNSKICVVIPVYNHCATARRVAEAALAHCPHVLIVDDGSTDSLSEALKGLPIDFHALPGNCGKGAAIKEAARIAVKAGFTHIVTMDADGQHEAADLPSFFKAILDRPEAIVIGRRDFSVPDVPGSSKFGRMFSAFWMFLQTGIKISDMQSGFRAYPLKILECINCGSNRYAFEIEILVKAAWAGFAIAEIPVAVWYPPKKERVSHFRTFMDNFRISVLNAKLTARALMPAPFRSHALKIEGGLSMLHPVSTFRKLLVTDDPHQLAKSAAWSLLISAIPVIGFNTIALLFAINWKRLNRLCALVMVPITWLPLIPGMCILLGYRMLNGSWLTDFSIQTLGHEAGKRFLDWLAGSLVVAPFLALSGYVLVYVFTNMLKR